ncbi:hypothetical protein ANN_20035, partial [Periplaneta americana]
ELSVKDLSVHHEPYRQNDPNKVVLKPIVRKEGQNENPVTPFKHRTRRYVLGYTGYIPGMNFRYGKSFQRSADDSVMEFSRRMSQEQVRREKDRGHRSQSAPKMPSIRSRDEVKKTLHHYHDRHKYGAAASSPIFLCSYFIFTPSSTFTSFSFTAVSSSFMFICSFAATSYSLPPPRSLRFPSRPPLPLPCSFFPTSYSLPSSRPLLFP